MQNLRGQTKSIMEFFEVAYSWFLTNAAMHMTIAGGRTKGTNDFRTPTWRL